MDRLCCRLAAHRNEVRKEQQGRGEMTIGHVDVVDVGEGIDPANFIGKPAEIGGPQ